ncbi:MAG: hypothetical protein JXR76_12240 [Deltaproteobacteria bacterium]|nr:hypothetical protein [Deltaproteobacteria bacterium]
MDILAGALSLDILYKNKGVASHVITTGKGLHSTKSEHAKIAHTCDTAI